MNVVLLSSTTFGYECLMGALTPLDSVRITGILTTPSKIDISYADEPVEISQHVDFRTAESVIEGDVVVADTVAEATYLELLHKWKPDFLLALGWYYVIPPTVRNYVPKGCAGIHASLLPRYRGGAPIPWAIINGEERTGVTFFYLEEDVDAGDIIAQSGFPITVHDTCATVYEKAGRASIDLLRKYLPKLAKGTAPRTPQNEEEATRFPQRSPEDGQINWDWSSERIYNFIRAQTKPYPGAFTFFQDRKVTLWKARLYDDGPCLRPGHVIFDGESYSENGFLVGTGDGVLSILNYEMSEGRLLPRANGATEFDPSLQ